MTSTSVSLPEDSDTSKHSRPLWLDISLEIGIMALVYFIYRVSRGSLPDKTILASNHALDIINAEKIMGIFVEQDIQSFFLQAHWRIDIANAMYTYAYYPPLVLFAIWAYWRHRDKYKTMRTVFVISAVLAFIIFALYPVAPPRFFDGRPGFDNLDFVDTMAIYWHVNDASAQGFYNPYAAMPSCHFAWALMIGIGIWWMTRSPWARLVGVLLPIIMLLGIVSTANHFVLDAVGGAIVLGVAFALAALLYRLKDRIKDRTATV